MHALCVCGQRASVRGVCVCRVVCVCGSVQAYALSVYSVYRMGCVCSVYRVWWCVGSSGPSSPRRGGRHCRDDCTVNGAKVTVSADDLARFIREEQMDLRHCPVILVDGAAAGFTTVSPPWRPLTRLSFCCTPLALPLALPLAGVPRLPTWLEREGPRSDSLADGYPPGLARTHRSTLHGRTRHCCTSRLLDCMALSFTSLGVFFF